MVSFLQVDIDPDLPEEITERQKAEQEKIDNVDPLTAEEEAEKWNLLRSVRICRNFRLSV